MRLAVRIALVALAAGAASQTHAAPAPAFVELFTSEGCSSCPPADALLERLVSEAGGRRVYGLSFHVDYWDQLGWRDRFSNAAYTRRQREYARRFGLASLYTPQIVVNGSRECVGSNTSAVRAAIDASPPSDVTPELVVTKSGDKIQVRCSVPHSPQGATLNVAWVQSRAVSSPNAGENHGRTLRHVNVVRDLQTVTLRQGFDDVLRLKRADVEEGEVIAWIQLANTGRVLGALAQRVGR